MSIQHGGNQELRFVVAGGGIAGLATALALGRAGARVTLVERDEVEAAPDPDAAFAIERPGAPQAHHSHAFLARMVAVLSDRFPDVLERIVDAGARTVDMAPGVDLTVLLARRTTVEWAFRTAVTGESTIDTITGRAITGLAGDPGGVAPRVTGAVLDDGTVLPGSVAACTGRRGDLSTWLRPLGVEITEQAQESDLMYMTRWYRVPAAEVAETRIAGDLGCIYYLGVPCDGDTMSISMAPAPNDRELRACLLDSERFDRIAARLPVLDRLFADGMITPISKVRPMAGLLNRLRRFTDDDGRPLVLGFHAVGDAHTCTNPAYGRGCSLALVQAAALADAFAEHPGDETARAAMYEAMCRREVEPWFHNSIALDSGRQALRDGGSSGAGAVFGSLFEALTRGAIDDPVVLRGFARVFNLLVTPEELFADKEFMARTMELMSSLPATHRPQPRLTRDDLLEAAA